ncbi:MAG: hypothetical protein JXA93_25220 [Anaerolineae bacterium]|nr:hypothetical protein [Anaerolineae bacterium]
MSKKLTLFLGLIVALLVPLAIVAAQVPQPASIQADTYIVVDTTADDPSDGYSVYCSDVAPRECSLRRAINEAYHLLPSATSRVYIEFDIATTDPGYDAALDAWKIELGGTVGDDLRELYGWTSVDGSTQPGGRDDGPKIIIDGLGNHTNGFIFRRDGNEVRGLAMQRFKTTHISISSDGNMVEDCWFGLSDDGTTLSSGDDMEPEGGSGVAWAADSDTNVVRNNKFAGFTGVAAAVRGANNVFSGNWIGADAAGLVPLPAQFTQHPCLYGTWNGGCGITVDGEENQIGGPTAAEGNHFVGLYLESFAITNQKPAMDVSGQGHLIQNNVIGLDGNDDEIGVCGRGISLLDGPEDMAILDTTIVEPALSGIMANHWTFNGVTLQGNLIKREREESWPGALPGQSSPEGAVVFAGEAPAELLSFVPAKVTQVDGLSVSGTAGEGSPCPYCIVELFLDDSDLVTETLQSLALVTANASGNWVATLPAPLESGQGLRTMSTVPDNFTIIGLHEGTTSGLSKLQAVAIRRIFLPFLLRND